MLMFSRPRRPYPSRPQGLRPFDPARGKAPEPRRGLRASSPRGSVPATSGASSRPVAGTASPVPLGVLRLGPWRGLHPLYRSGFGLWAPAGTACPVPPRGLCPCALLREPAPGPWRDCVPCAARGSASGSLSGSACPVPLGAMRLGPGGDCVLEPRRGLRPHVSLGVRPLGPGGECVPCAARGLCPCALLWESAPGPVALLPWLLRGGLSLRPAGAPSRTPVGLNGLVLKRRTGERGRAPRWGSAAASA